MKSFKPVLISLTLALIACKTVSPNSTESEGKIFGLGRSKFSLETALEKTSLTDIAKLKFEENEKENTDFLSLLLEKDVLQITYYTPRAINGDYTQENMNKRGITPVMAPFLQVRDKDILLAISHILAVGVKEIGTSYYRQKSLEHKLYEIIKSGIEFGAEKNWGNQEFRLLEQTFWKVLDAPGIVGYDTIIHDITMSDDTHAKIAVYKLGTSTDYFGYPIVLKGSNDKRQIVINIDYSDANTHESQHSIAALDDLGNPTTIASSDNEINPYSAAAESGTVVQLASMDQLIESLRNDGIKLDESGAAEAGQTLNLPFNYFYIGPAGHD